jgi:hypothetical protein
MLATASVAQPIPDACACPQHLAVTAIDNARIGARTLFRVLLAPIATVR